MRSLFSVVQTISSMYDHTQGWYIGEWTSQRFGKDSGWFQKSLWKPWSARKSHCLRLYLYFLLCIRPIGACCTNFFSIQREVSSSSKKSRKTTVVLLQLILTYFILINFISLRLVSILLPFSNPWFLHFFNFVLRFSMQSKRDSFCFFFSSFFESFFAFCFFFLASGHLRSYECIKSNFLLLLSNNLKIISAFCFMLLRQLSLQLWCSVPTDGVSFIFWWESYPSLRIFL